MTTLIDNRTDYSRLVVKYSKHGVVRETWSESSEEDQFPFRYIREWFPWKDIMARIRPYAGKLRNRII